MPWPADYTSMNVEVPSRDRLAGQDPGALASFDRDLTVDHHPWRECLPETRLGS